jgi:copper(I)-binding protein
VERRPDQASSRTLTASTAAAVLTAAALLSGCSAGFDATSVKPYAPSDGIMADSGHLRILNTLVVASDSFSSGVVVATIVNDGSKADELTSITSPDGKVDLTGDGTIEPGSAVGLSAGTELSATISSLTSLPGETITLHLRFKRADPVTINTVVVPASGPYATITPAPTPSPT